MALIEKTRKITQTYLVPVCDGCGSEAVTTNVDDKIYCDACLTTQPAPDTQSVKGGETQ